jgi:RNA polymerase sigma factor (sigma-70 family)
MARVVDPSSRADLWQGEEPGMPDRPPSPSTPTGASVSDEQLMVAHAAGDPEAFARLYQRYARPLLQMMVRQHCFTDDARDLVRQTFLQLHRARADYDPSHPFRPWLYTIARNLSREEGGEWQPPATEPSAEALAPAETYQVARAVRIAIQALPRDERDVIELHWFDGLDFPEIAQSLGVPVNATKLRAHRGYQSLRAHLKSLMR